MAKIANVIPCDPSKPYSNLSKIFLSDNNTEYAFCNLKGRIIYAGERTAIYENPSSKKPMYLVEKGKPIGILDSYLDYGTHIFLTFVLQKNEIGKIVFLKEKTISDAFLKKEKIKTKAEQQKDFDEENKKQGQSWYENLVEDLGEGFMTAVKWTAILGGGYLVVKETTKEKPAVTGAKKKRQNRNLLIGGAAAFLLWKITQQKEDTTPIKPARQSNANTPNSSNRSQRQDITE
jgi:hypothetical protein